MDYAFQLEDQNLRTIFEYYAVSREYAFMLLPVVAISRYIFALKGGVEDQFNVFKDVVICCLLLLTFSSFITIAMELPQYISKWTTLGEVAVNVNPIAGSRFSIWVSILSKWVTYACYVIAKAIYYISLLLLCFIAAWVILGVTMTSFFSAFIVFVIVFLFVCLIPTFWTLINLGTKILFDPKDPDWNNSILVLSSAAKAFLTIMSFKKVLYEPFLQKLHETSKSIVKKGAQTAALASSGVGLSGKALTALGGQKYITGTSNAMKKMKSAALKQTQKTIPTAEKIVSTAAKSAWTGLSKTGSSFSKSKGSTSGKVSSSAGINIGASSVNKIAKNSLSNSRGSTAGSFTPVGGTQSVKQSSKFASQIQKYKSQTTDPAKSPTHIRNVSTQSKTSFSTAKIKYNLQSNTTNQKTQIAKPKVILKGKK